MLDALKFIKPALSSEPGNDFFQIKNGRATAFNGILALSAPITTDLTINPHGETFFRAISVCGDEARLRLGDNLTVSGKKARITVPLFDIPLFKPGPEGDVFEAPENVKEMLEAVYLCLGTETARPWATGAMFSGPSLFATNNVILVEYWTALEGFPPVNVPRPIVERILKSKDKPVAFQTDGRSLTVHYDGDRWMRTQLYEDQWPMPMIAKLLSNAGEQKPLPDGFAEAIETIGKFCKNDASRLKFGDGVIMTVDEHAAVELPGIPAGPSFNIKQLRILAELATTVDFLCDPSPFRGNMIRGVAVRAA